MIALDAVSLAERRDMIMVVSDVELVKGIQGKRIADGERLPRRQTAHAQAGRIRFGETAAGGSMGKTADVVSENQDGATVAISAEGMGLVSRQTEDEKASMQEEIERRMYQEMLEKANEAAEAQEEGYGDLAKALEIARRILNGDIVPSQDEQFLMEFNSEIYMRVKSMAKAKEDPEEYDTLLEEEEDDKSEKTAGSGSDSGSGGSVRGEAQEVSADAVSGEEN